MWARFCTSLCEIESCRHFSPKCGPYLDRLPYYVSHVAYKETKCPFQSPRAARNRLVHYTHIRIIVHIDLPWFTKNKQIVIL